ncbi:response regulator [Plebeiibacterium marinum]|uniref:Response regulator n=1 Tax=Plebeiibacterium marinum TaxID=2992111 RepID=A0AAE3MAD9_9BACT|nr:response regulator [Plebeiobacterium marinum]MCW3804231.1 response regulator [Plebeiobacterium marinum]
MRKVFIVEDDKFITAIFTMFLRDLGHDLVGKTASGSKAIEMCRELQPDVVLMDIHLDGDLDGIQTAEMLNRELHIPVIYVSSDTSSQVIERAIVSNSYGYLVKPINKKELGISIDLAFYKHKVDMEQKEREQSYREFISASPLPIIVLNNGKLAYLNCLGLDIFKTHYIEDVIGSDIKEFIHEDCFDQYDNIMAMPLDAGKRIDPCLLKMKDVHGDLYWAEVTGSIVKFNNKKSIQLIIKDVSDQMYYEGKVIAYEKMMDDAKKFCMILNGKGEIIKSNDYTKGMLAECNIIGKEVTDFIRTVGSDTICISEFSSKNTDKIRVMVQGQDEKEICLRAFVTIAVDGSVSEILLIECISD